MFFHNIFTSFWIFRIINIKWVKARKSSLFIINTMNTMHTIPWHKLDQLFRSITAIPCKFSVHALSVAKVSLERMQLFLVFCTIKFLGYAFWIMNFLKLLYDCTIYFIYKLENRLYDMIKDIVCTMFKSFIRYAILKLFVLLQSWI